MSNFKAICKSTNCAVPQSVCEYALININTNTAAVMCNVFPKPGLHAAYIKLTEVTKFHFLFVSQTFWLIHIDKNVKRWFCLPYLITKPEMQKKCFVLLFIWSKTKP